MGRYERFCIPVLALLLIAACGEKVELSEKQRNVSLDWLRLVDSSDYMSSWDESSEIFRQAISSEAWVQAVKAVRGPLGAMKTREFLSAKEVNDPPGQPDGRYIVISYESSFEGKAKSIETHTLVFSDGDPEWANAGYFIR